MRSVNRHAPSTRSKRSWYSPARIGCSPWPVTCSTVKQLRAVAAAPVDLHRHVRDLVQRLRRAVVVDDHAVVVRARLGGAAQPAVVAGRAELGVLEQRGDTVEVAGVEQERVLVDQRGDLVVDRSSATGRIGTVAQPRTLPECTRVQPASSIS